MRPAAVGVQNGKTLLKEGFADEKTIDQHGAGGQYGSQCRTCAGFGCKYRGGGKNSADPDPVAAQKVDSLDGLFQPPQTLTKDTIYIGTSSTTTVSTWDELTAALNNSNSSPIITVTKTLEVPSGDQGTLNLGEHTLSASGSFTGSELISINGGTLTLTNGTLDGNNKTRCVYVGQGDTSSFTLGAGATIQNGKSDSGAGVFVGKGTFTMEKGSRITNCCANYFGGAVSIAGNGTDDTDKQFIMNGGTIENCATPNCGAIRNSALFIMNGGTIEKNNLTGDNGQSAALFNAGTFHANGGEIKDTVYNNNGGNTVYRGVIDSPNGKTGTTFSDTVYNGGTISGGSFGYIMMLNGGTLDDNVPGTLLYTAGSANELRETINKAGTRPIAIQLTDDIELTSTLEMYSNATINLDLGGHTLKASDTFNGSNDQRLIYVGSGTLTVTNGTLDGNNKTGCVYVWVSSSFTLGAGATIQNGNGGGVWNSGSFTMMDGSKITNCTAANGGAVCNYASKDTATFTMNGGEITGCTSNDGQSDAVYSSQSMRQKSIFNANGGTVNGTVKNNSNCKITVETGKSGTTFSDKVYNWGTIENGTFVGAVENHGSITGGTFKNRVDNYKIIEGANSKFTGDVYNHGTIENGTFDGKATNFGTIEAGNFTGTVENKSEGGKISGGTFTSSVTNYGTITSGTYTGTVTNENTGVISGGDFSKGKLINNGGTVSSDVVKPEEPEKPNPDDTKKDDDKPGTEEPAKPVVTYALTVKNAEVTIEDAGKTVEATKNEDGTLTAKVPEGAKVTVKYTAPTDAIVFDLWSITSDATLDVNVKENPLTFTMPDKAVTVEAMTRDATIESDGPGILGTAAMIGVGVAGTAVLGYQGYMIGTELYLNSVLPEGAAIPQNYGELAKLVWDNAGRPEPIALLAADATDEQKALTWAIENQLISADKAADASVTRWEVIQTWNQEQEMEKV